MFKFICESFNDSVPIGGNQIMCETKIEFKCLNCGTLYNPYEELDCPECDEKDRGLNKFN